MPDNVTTSKNRLLAYIVSGVVLIAVLAVGLFVIFQRLTSQPAEGPVVANVISGNSGDGGTVLDPPRELLDFELTNQDGQPMHLSDLRGRMVLLYFGYTHCPDFCPLTLEKFQAVQTLLGDRADEVAFVFISVDGERDTPEALARYLEVRRVPDFIAMTGDETELRQIGVDYGLFFEKRTDTGSQANYLVDHTSASFLIDRQGQLAVIFGFDVKPDKIAEEIQVLLS